MVRDFLKAQAKNGDVNAARKALESLHPVGRLGEKADVAYAVLYLASDESTFAPGSELVIVGGYTAQWRSERFGDWRPMRSFGAGWAVSAKAFGLHETR